MVFSYIISDELAIIIEGLKRKNRPLALELFKKMDEIVSRDNVTIEFYKNLKRPMNEYKRVHIGHFVLKFKADKERNLIIFAKFDHHDKIY